MTSPGQKLNSDRRSSPSLTQSKDALVKSKSPAPLMTIKLHQTGQIAHPKASPKAALRNSNVPKAPVVQTPTVRK